MPTKDLLFASPPTPPIGAIPVGQSPANYLAHLPAQHSNSLGHLGIALGAPINRTALRTICLDPQVTELAKYACVMAWGGQRYGNYYATIDPATLPALTGLIQYLFHSTNTRTVDFDYTKQVCAAQINGFGISFFTKLIFFLRPKQDAYILDQWTAKSACLACFPHPIPLSVRLGNGYLAADPATTGINYETFCSALENLAASFWPWVQGLSGESVELAMFDRSRPDGFWRKFTRVNFTNPFSGALLQGGAESLTSPLDYRCGYLVIRRITPQRIYVIQINGSCCSWTQDDLYRFLLARLRELKNTYILPVTVVLPPGDCPEWLNNALDKLGIIIEISQANIKCQEMQVDVDAEGKVDDEDAEPLLSVDGTVKVNSESNPVIMKLQDKKPVIYLSDTNAAALTLKENHAAYWNVGWLCRNHWVLDLKAINAPHVNRYLIGEIAAAGGDFVHMPGYINAQAPATHCCGGGGYEGGVPFGTAEDAVHYLKIYFDVRACPANAPDYNQAWINAC